MVTHQLQFLQFVDEIVILSNGKVEAAGSFDSLRESGLDFAKLLDEPATEEINNEPTSSTKVDTRSTERTSNASQIKMEEKRLGEMSGLKVFAKYFKASGGYLLFLLVGFFCIVAQILASGGDYYVNFW